MADDGVPKLLAGEKLFFASGHLEGIALRALSALATDLGAEVVSTREAATIILVNPGSPHYKPITGGAQMPYHWLSQCRIKHRRLGVRDLAPDRPFMQHATPTKEGHPVLIYVSKNVLRDPGQLDLPVWKMIGDDLAAAGAIIVGKRSEADVLVVDRKSSFYKNKIKPEIQQYNRTHQRVGERSWVDQCLAQGRFLNLSVEEEEEARQERHVREDSFAEEDEPVLGPKSKGGRPVGKPRVEYTPEDDDFLCRYLAAFHPGGAWTSRKTYEVMTQRSREFPIVDRHTKQSWHERFKKNAKPFEHRVNRFISHGINNKLLTVEEVAREREKREKRAEAAASASSPQQPDTPTASSSKGKERAAPPASKRRLTLLSDDDDDDDPEPPKSKHKVSDASQPVGRTARIEALGPAPEITTEPTTLKTTAAEASRQAETRESAAQVTFEPDLDILPAAPVRKETTAVAVVEKTVRNAAGMEASSVSITVIEKEVQSDAERAPTPRTTPPTPQPNVANSPRTPAPPGRAATPKSAPAPVATPKQRSTVAVPSTAPQLSPHSVRAPTQAAASPSHPPSTLEAPPAQRPRTPETSQPTQTTADTATPRRTPRDPGKRQPVPVQEHNIPSPLQQVHARRTSVEAGPARRALEQEIAAAQKKQAQAVRRRSVDKIASVARPAAHALAAQTAQEQQPPQQQQPQAQPLPAGLQPPAEILTPAERAERVAAGAATVQNQKEIYRQRIVAYTAKYKLSIGDLLKIVADVTRNIKGEMYWDAVDKGLRNKFGY